MTFCYDWRMEEWDKEHDMDVNIMKLAGGYSEKVGARHQQDALKKNRLIF